MSYRTKWWLRRVSLLSAIILMAGLMPTSLWSAEAAPIMDAMFNESSLIAGLASPYAISTITKSVYQSGGGTTEVMGLDTGADEGGALSWNWSVQLDHGSTLSSDIDATDIGNLLSADGRFFAFKISSWGRGEVLEVEDRRTGEIRSIPTPEQTGQVFDFDMSEDGRYFVYNYVTGDMSKASAIYWYDRETDTLELVNDIRMDDPQWEGENNVSISDNGRYVAFDAFKGTLAKPGVYLYDHEGTGDGKLKWIGLEEEGVSYFSYDPSISADGSEIAFISQGSLTDDDSFYYTPGYGKVFIYDRNAMPGAAFEQVAIQGESPSLSGDGRYLAFTTILDDDLAQGDTNFRNDIYVYDKVESRYHRVSRREDGSENATDSRNPAISRNGAYVTYEVEQAAENGLYDIYVADSQGLASTKITVPASSFPYTNGGRPTVGDTGQTLTFWGADADFTPEAYFIADNFSGTDPVWPDGSMLQGSHIGTDALTLRWPQATDPDGVDGYAIYKDDIPIAYVSATDARTITLTKQALGGNVYGVFEVGATNSHYHRSVNNPTYKWDSQDGDSPPPVETPVTITWAGGRSGQGPLKLGSPITIRAHGPANREAAVEWSYKAWEGDVQAAKTASLALTESANTEGLYTGTFELPPDAAELSAMTLSVAGDGQVETKAAVGLPVPVGGDLQIEFAGTTSLSELEDAILTVTSPTTGMQSFTLGNDGIAPLRGLWPGPGNTITLRTPNYRYELGRMEGVSIQPGRTRSVTLPVLPLERIQVKLQDAEGNPVPSIPVTLWDEDHQYLGHSTTGIDGLTPWQGGLPGGLTVTAELQLKDTYYEIAHGSERSLKLSERDQLLPITVNSPERGNLAVAVKNENNAAVFNAYVTATQTIKGKPVVTKSRTGLDGKARLTLFPGEVKLEASQSSELYSSDVIQAQVVANTTTSLDISVRQPGTGIIHLEVYKKALDTGWQGPLELGNENIKTTLRGVPSNQRSRSISKLSGYTSLLSKYYFSNTVMYGGNPGDPVEVCVYGTIYAAVSTCTDVVLDENANATAELRLEETGARVQGKVEGDGYYSAQIYEVASDGSKSWVENASNDAFQRNPFNIHVPHGGTYEMVISQFPSWPEQDQFARVQFTIQDGQINQLGTIAFSSSNDFAGQPGNSLIAQPARALPGSTLTLRAAYQNHQDQTASDARLLLEIPQGMTLVTDGAGNAAVSGGNGSPATVQGQMLLVPLGDLRKGDSGTVTCKIQVDDAFDRNGVSIAARLQADLGTEPVEEIIGTVYLDTPGITMHAPATMADEQMLLPVNGLAPAGSTVDIYDTGVKIGGAVANAMGAWSSEVTLTDLGSPSVHELIALTSYNNVTLQSEPGYTKYDKDGPQLMQIAFNQMYAGSSWATMDRSKRIPNFSYTVHPGYPFEFEVVFNKPDLVENVRVYMDGQVGSEPVPARRDGNLFRTTVPTAGGALGDIYVAFDRKPVAHTYDGSLPDMDQIRASFPPTLRDFEVVSATPFELADGKYTGSVTVSFPQLEDKKMSITLTIDPESDYVPTEEEIALAERSGIPAIQKDFDDSETDTSFTIAMNGYVPRNLLFDDDHLKLERSRVMTLGPSPAAKTGDWGHTAQYFMEIKSDVDSASGPISDIKGQYESYQSFADKVNSLMYGVSNGADCLNELPTTIREAGKALAALVLGEVAKTALGAWTGAMSLTGVGGIAAGFASGIISDQIDHYVDEQIGKVGTGFNECNDSDTRYPDTPHWNEYNPDQQVDGPEWIYDPSGYVYEAVKSNPLEGVTATVLYQDLDSGAWKVWDAAAYSQTNPQSTNVAGEYGWDVPAGKWKVVWSKSGYEPRTSAEMDVPPPYTDVNAGLVSRAAPQMDTVTGVTYSGGSYVEVTFTKYLQAIDLPAGAVTVTDSNGHVLDGTAEFAYQEASASEPGVLLSRTVRFLPQAGLETGGTYKVKLDPGSMISYAHVQMLDEDAGPRSFTVEELDTTGPAVDSAQVESGGRIVRVTFDQPIQSSGGDAAKFLLDGAGGLVTSAVADPQHPGELLLSLSGSLTAAAQLTLLDGAVQDTQGNASAAAAVSLTPDLIPNLSQLKVSSGTLSPTFKPDTMSYSLQLAPGTQELAVTATTADASASLKIGMEPAISGLARTVTVPEDGIIRITVTEGGVAAKTYTLQVVYVQNGNAGGSPASPQPPTGDPLDLGTTASIEKKTTQAGGLSVQINLVQSGIAAALKTGQESPALYIEEAGPADEIILQLSLESLRMMQKAHASLLLQTPLIPIKLETTDLQTEGLAEGSMIRLTVRKATESLTKAAEEAVRQQSITLKLRTPLMFVQLEAINGKITLPIATIGGDGLQGQFAERQGKDLGVYRYNDASDTWIYVESIEDGNDTGLRFAVTEPGPYAGMSFTNPFIDTAGHWASKDIDWMARRLLIYGELPNQFKPDDTVTRAEFTAMLVRALGITEPEDHEAHLFTDVKAEDWFYHSILAAESEGILFGTGVGQFSPNDPITREQMAVMSSRAYRFLQPDDTLPVTHTELDPFTDSDLLHAWAKVGVEQAIRMELLQGMTIHTLDPLSLTTRAQAAAVIHRLLVIHALVQARGAAVVE